MLRIFAILTVGFIFLGNAQEIGARYLIITHDDYYNAILPLAQWKHKKGMRTKIVKLTETGPYASQIKNYIVNAYNTWQIKPEFILLVGAPNFLPFPQVNSTYSDNYYTNVTGDFHNDLYSGRLTVRSVSQAQTVVNKILLYERTPDTLDATWLRKGCGIARTEWDNYVDSIYFEDVHYYASLMVANGYVHYDTLSNNFGDNSTDVINSVNNGCGFVLYRGSATNNWYMPFDCNADQTTNGARLPIVLSLTCLTLSTGATPTAAEKWFYTGSPTVPRGACGYFASTTGIMNGAHLRSAIAKGFADAVFIAHKKTFAEACENGRLRVYNIYGNLGEYYGFTTVGDPEMNLRTARPKTLTVVHDTLLYAWIVDTLNVSVTHSGSPVESALVCIVFDTLVYQMAYTDAGGAATFFVYAPYTGTMDVTVTGTNLYPYEGTVDIVEFGIAESSAPVDKNNGLRIYPSLFRDKISIVLGPGRTKAITPGTMPVAPCIRIYDACGKLVKQWSSADLEETNRVAWDARDESSRHVPAGVYFVHLTAGTGFHKPGSLIRVEKIVLLE